MANTITKVKQAFSNAINRLITDKANETVSVTDFGASTGSTDNTAAFQALDTNYPAGQLGYVPAGTYTIKENVVFTGNRMRLTGANRLASILQFNPTGPGDCLYFNNPSAGGYFQGEVSHLGFTSTNTTSKAAIVLNNTANMDIHHIAIGAGVWPGDNVFLQTKGRQSLNLRFCDIACARPILMSPNTVFPTLTADHFLIEHCELIGTSATRPVIEIEAGAMLTNTTFRNLAIVQGKHGIYWVDGAVPGTSYKLKFENIRFEQPLDVTGWDMDLEVGPNYIQDIELDNVYFCIGRNGLKLRNAQRITMTNCTFPDTTGTAIDITMVAGSKLVMTNVLTNGAAITITNGRCVRRESVAGFTGIVEEWVYDDGYSAGAEQSDTYHSGVPFTLADGGTHIIGDYSTTGFVFISTAEDTSAIYCLSGSTGTVVEVSDPFGHFSNAINTATMTNIYWDGTNYKLQNKRGHSMTYAIYKVCTTA